MSMTSKQRAEEVLRYWDTRFHGDAMRRELEAAFDALIAEERERTSMMEMTSKYVAAYLVAKPESSGRRWSGERILKSAIGWAKATILCVENESEWRKDKTSEAKPLPCRVEVEV
jgi:cytochrome P450